MRLEIRGAQFGLVVGWLCNYFDVKTVAQVTKKSLGLNGNESGYEGRESDWKVIFQFCIGLNDTFALPQESPEKPEMYGHLCMLSVSFLRGKKHSWFLMAILKCKVRSNRPFLFDRQMCFLLSERNFPTSCVFTFHLSLQNVFWSWTCSRSAYNF